MIPFVSKKVLKEELGLSQQSTSVDEALDRYINAVTSRIEKYCEQPIRSQTGNVVYVISGRSGFLKRLPFFPVRGIVSLSYSVDSGGDDVVVDPSLYRVRQKGSSYVLRLDDGFRPERDYIATLTVGYDEGEVPGLIYTAAWEMMVMLARKSGLAEPVGERRLGVSSITVARADSGITETKVLEDELERWKGDLDGYKALEL